MKVDGSRLTNMFRVDKIDESAAKPGGAPLHDLTGILIVTFRG